MDAAEKQNSRMYLNHVDQETVWSALKDFNVNKQRESRKVQSVQQQKQQFFCGPRQISLQSKVFSKGKCV